jgi:hypothetical protein
MAKVSKISRQKLGKAPAAGTVKQHSLPSHQAINEWLETKIARPEREVVVRMPRRLFRALYPYCPIREV